MPIPVLVGAALATVSVVLALAWPVGQARRERMATAFAAKVDLGLRPDPVESVGGRLVQRARLLWGPPGWPSVPWSPPRGGPEAARPAS